MSDLPVSNHEDLRKQERALRIRNLKKNLGLFFGNKLCRFTAKRRNSAFEFANTRFACVKIN